ncbi:MAG: molybdopterin-dependent oxidoreductase [Bacillota bacterium]|nr:molybdopterin-dependent oxidoreductase [Bacillota bacterium]
MSAINLTIDGINIEVPPGTTILQAARQLGIDIPTFCYDKELSANGACRICVVEVENARALVASCVAPVGPGMIIHTESERVINARKSILSLLIANHPLVCITCEKTGECKLQDYCYRYGITDSEFVGEVKELSLDDTNEFFVRDMNKCILCGICVGKCQDVVGAGAIDFTSRGFVTNVGPAFEDRIEDSTCVFCGLCIDSCPVGALTPKSKLGQGRPWQVELVKTICPYCSLGCGINLQVKDNKPIGVTPVTESPVNRGHLCIKGKFGWDYLNSEDRLTTPLIKSNGVFIEVSWEEALSYIVDNLDDIKTRYGADALMGLCSPKTGNEESYLFQKFIRSMGTNNVDSYTRHCHAPSVDGLMKAFGSAALTNSIEEIASAKTIFVIEADPLESHPILGYRIREAVRKGGQLILANHGHAGLTELANQYLQFKPGTAVALVNAMAQVIIEEGLTDKAFIGKRTEGFDAFTGHIARYTPAYAAKITGLTEEEIKTAARAYAGAETAAIVSKAGATESGGGTDLVLALANLALLTGNLGKESTGLYLPYGENNLQGCADMGGLPAVLPGYQTIREKSIRDKFSRSWGVQISDKPGLSAAEMFENPEQSGIKALYIMGENPVSCRHEDQKMVNFLKELEFLVVQDIFMTETASLADVILPAAAYGEKTVTYTNTERRVQISNAAVEPPGEAHPDWAIIAELAGWLGFEWEYGGPEEIMAEIASLVPQYAGISYERLIDHGLQWPCPTPGHSGTKYLYEGRFGRGLGLFSPVDFKPYVEEAVGSEVYTEENGEHPCSCLSESMTRRSVISVFKDSCNC